MSIPILDCHQHLVYPENWPYSWTADIPALAGKAFTMEDYLDQWQDDDVVRTIFMETAPDDPHGLDEAKYMMGLADREGSPMEGLILACHPEEEGDFEAYLDATAHPKRAGYRRILHVAPDEMSQQARFVENVRRLERHGLTFDMCFLSRQLPRAVELASRCEGVQLVLDHCGVPDIAGGGLDPWREHIRELAERPNVACKISGVVAYCAPGQVSADALRPYVEHCIESFGWDRVVWGSDWPVCNMTSSLHDWVALARELVAGESEENQHKLFHANAERIYLKTTS